MIEFKKAGIGFMLAEMKKNIVSKLLLKRKKASVCDKNTFENFLLQDAKSYKNYLKINTVQVSKYFIKF